MNEDLLITQYPEIVEPILLMELSTMWSAEFAAGFLEINLAF